MTDRLQLGNGPSETVLPPADPQLLDELERAKSGGKEAVALVAAQHPASSQVWAYLAETAEAPMEIYAYARVGYHRGLDALRAAGWRGSGYVRWREPSNRGFLRCLEILQREAEAIGETAEAKRCAIFLRQLDPDWELPKD